MKLSLEAVSCCCEKRYALVCQAICVHYLDGMFIHIRENVCIYSCATSFRIQFLRELQVLRECTLILKNASSRQSCISINFAVFAFINSCFAKNAVDKEILLFSCKYLKMERMDIIFIPRSNFFVYVFLLCI